ncbi:hypothetical protein CCP2SC5_50065 [Azospirillaceae bacterium]
MYLIKIYLSICVYFNRFMEFFRVRFDFFLNRMSLIIKISCIVFIFTILLSTYHFMRVAKFKFIEKNVNKIEYFTEIFENHIDNIFRIVDLTLNSIQSVYQMNYNIEDVRGFFDQYVYDKQLLSNILVLDINGNILFTSGEVENDFVSDYLFINSFVHNQKISKDDNLFISYPIVNKNSKKAYIYIARRIKGLDGRFVGTVMASVLSDSLMYFYYSLNIGPNGNASLVGLDRFLRAKAPFQSWENGPFDMSGSVLWSSLLNSSHGLYHQIGVLDSVPRTYAYRQFRNYPLVILIGVSDQDIDLGISELDEQLIVLALIVSIFIIIVTALLLTIYRQNEYRQSYQKKIMDTKLELERQREQLSRSTEEIEHFSDVLAHHLQEPVRLVFNYADLLHQQCQGILDSDALESLHLIVDGATRLKRLLQDVQIYISVNRGNYCCGLVEMSDADVALNIALSRLGSLIHENDVVIQRRPPLPIVPISESRLSEVFYILINNAIHYKNPREALQIAVFAHKTEFEVVFSVSDNGIGIEKCYHEKIFRVFERLHPRSNYSGTGIGLALARKIIDYVGGRLWVDSNPGQGSIFYFSIPLVRSI